MSTRAFITGVSGAELTAAERAFVRAERPWGFVPFKRSIEISAQVTAPIGELTATRLIAADLAGLSIPVDGAADPAHLATSSATIIAQMIRGAVGFQGLLVSDDVSMNAPAGSVAERIRTMLVAGCGVERHCNDNFEVAPLAGHRSRAAALIARVNTASA
jgi:beta-glucosidase-like glycosyl hydrolase